MEIYHDDFWTISFDNEHSIITAEWSENSLNLTDDIYKLKMEKYTQFIEQYKAQKALANCLKLGFVISPSVQEWTNNVLFPRILAVGQHSVAVVLPNEFITQLSLEQILEEEKGQKFVSRYFDNAQDARTWLISR